jgi:hypothetical protein
MPPGSCDRKDEGVAGTVERICASPGFLRSARLQRFLRFLASTQAAVGCGPKEYEIAREVYDKPEDFNPQTDPIVRVEASRPLRAPVAKMNWFSNSERRLLADLPLGSEQSCAQSGKQQARRTLSPRQIFVEQAYSGIASAGHRLLPASNGRRLL